MGVCTVRVVVAGGHHNGSLDDIDQIAKRFAADLALRGHDVREATLTLDGGALEELQSAKRIN